MLVPILFYGQVDTNHVYIKIEEWNAWNSNEYFFTDSTISVKRNCTLMGLFDRYEKETYSRSLNNLKEYLTETNLDSVKARYSNNYIDDNLEYDFTIVYNGKKTTKHIYMTEYVEYIRLVELLNEIIPEYFAIEYDYNYLHGKLKIYKN